MAEETEKIWFRNVKEVSAYLRDAGYKISQSSVYNHNGQGKLVSDENGGFSKKAVDRYVKTWLEKADQVPVGRLVAAHDDKKQLNRRNWRRRPSTGRSRPTS